METVIVKNGVYQVGAQCAQTPFLAEMANSSALYYQCNVEDICIDLVSKRIPAADIQMSGYNIIDSGFCSSPVYCASDVVCNDPMPEFALSFYVGLLAVGRPALRSLPEPSGSTALVTYDCRISTDGGVVVITSCARGSAVLPFGFLGIGYSAIAGPPAGLGGDFVFSYYRAYNKNRV